MFGNGIEFSITLDVVWLTMFLKTSLSPILMSKLFSL